MAYQRRNRISLLSLVTGGWFFPWLVDAPQEINILSVCSRRRVVRLAGQWTSGIGISLITGVVFTLWCRLLEKCGCDGFCGVNIASRIP